MVRPALVLSLSASVLACANPAGDTGDHWDIGGDYTASGTEMSAYLPLDGQREAAYYNAGEDWMLVGQMLLPSRREGDSDVFSWEWSRDDTGELVGSIDWSSDVDNGIRIHGYAAADGLPVAFEPPIAFADAEMSVGDRVTTDTNLWTFTSTFVGFEDCPVTWGLDWEECVHVLLDDGDGDDASGPWFTGEYWLVQRYGPAWMLLPGQEQKWDLADYDWAAE